MSVIGLDRDIVRIVQMHLVPCLDQIQYFRDIVHSKPYHQVDAVILNPSDLNFFPCCRAALYRHYQTF